MYGSGDIQSVVKYHSSSLVAVVCDFCSNLFVDLQLVAECKICEINYPDITTNL